jgi:pyridoxine 5-phosphate synthase
MNRLRLGVNIDHVATIRNARGGRDPDPVRAAKLAATAGADGITAHLREDRRHISDEDISRLSREIDLPLNLEMAATDEMLAIALKHRPHAACIVPEKREERTTEGGIDAAGQHNRLAPMMRLLGQSRTSACRCSSSPISASSTRRRRSARRSSNFTRAPIAMPRPKAM